MPRMARFLGATIPAALLLATESGAQERPRVDTLSGVARSERGIALTGVDVLVTRGPDRAVFAARTGADGTWRVVVAPGTGDYLVYASMAGRKPFRQRVVFAAPQRAAALAVALDTVVAQLATVVVRAAQRQPPPRTLDGFEARRGNAEVEQDGLNGAVRYGAEGDPIARAGAVPGVVVTTGGVSVLGSSPDQTLVTLNGLSVPLTELPRGLDVTTRVATTAWDVARGGFSGGQVDVTVSPGGFFRRRSVSVLGSDPRLAPFDPVARSTGAGRQSVDVSAVADGPVDDGNRYVFSAGARLRRTASPVASLVDARPDVLETAGLTSAVRDSLVTAARSRGLVGDPRGFRTGYDGQAIVRLDRDVIDRATGAPTPVTFGVLGVLSARTIDGQGITPLGGPAVGTSINDRTWVIQAYRSSRRSLWLRELRASLSGRSERTTPLAGWPRAVIRLPGEAGSGGVPSFVSLGADGNGINGRDRTTFEVTQDAQRTFGRDAGGRLKLFAQLRGDRISSVGPSQSGGILSYASLSDFASSQPWRLTRPVADGRLTTAVFNGALGIGWIRRWSPRLTTQAGIRADASSFEMPRDAEAAAEAVTERRAVAALSPRVGFRWAYGNAAPATPASAGPIGRLIPETPGVFRGGVGRFRSFVPAGLPLLLRRGAAIAAGNECLGTDILVTPALDGSLEATCRVPSGEVPAVRTGSWRLDDRWRPSDAWRANLAWNTRTAGLDIGVETIGSLSFGISTTRDANFAGVPLGVLALDGGRPIFVTSGAVDPATGVVDPRSARRDSTRTVETRVGSVGRLRAGQLRLSVTPALSGRTSVRLAYALSMSQALRNGYDGSTGGDPRRTEWAPAETDARHQVQVQAGRYWRNASASVVLSGQSGLPFTPLVSGDINGDGLSFNDRAFVLAAPRGDAAAAATMRELLGSPTPRIASCLRRNLGRIAAPGSCRGPWSFDLNAVFSLDGSSIRGGDDWRLTVSFENVLAGLDYLVHDGRPRGWGIGGVPDPVLLMPVGWDRQSNAFTYRVNSRFGQSAPERTLLRIPYRVSLDVRVPFGAPYPEQQLVRFLSPGRGGRGGARLSVSDLELRYAQAVPDLYAAIMVDADTLLLSPGQLDSLQQRRQSYVQEVTPILRDLARYLASLPDRYDAAEALDRQDKSLQAAWQVAWRHAQDLSGILTPGQLQVVPYPASMLRRARSGAGIRVF